MRQGKRKTIWIVLSYVITALAAGAVVCFAVKLGNQGKLDRLEYLIANRFVEEFDETAIEDAAANAMVEALGDRWSHYLTAQQYRDYQAQSENSYVGIGVTVVLTEDGAISISEVVPGAPAQAAGILPGDVLLQVDGVSCQGMTLSQIGELIRGVVGEQMVLTMERAGERVELPVTFAQFDVPVAASAMLEDQIGLVTIENFGSRCAQETAAAIEELLTQGAKALIFDVRNNPGGYRSELVEVLDELLPEGVLFATEDYAGRREEDRSDSACLELPMAVLVNGDSYSAAEFFAAALQEYEAAVVVGSQTCGKGHFQTVYRLPGGAAVSLSIGRYYTPNGVNLEGIGLTPDIPVEVDEQTAAAIAAHQLEVGEDPQLAAAVEALEEKLR